MSAEASGKPTGSDRDANLAAQDRPAPWALPPDGMHFEAVEDEEWIVPPVGAGRCRFMVGRRACGKPPVATLMRPNYVRAPRRQPWYYCEEHLYGRWMEDGKVMHWRLVEDAD